MTKVLKYPICSQKAVVEAVKAETKALRVFQRIRVIGKLEGQWIEKGIFYGVNF